MNIDREVAEVILELESIAWSEGLSTNHEKKENEMLSYIKETFPDLAEEYSHVMEGI